MESTATRFCSLYAFPGLMERPVISKIPNIDSVAQIICMDVYNKKTYNLSFATRKTEVREMRQVVHFFCVKLLTDSPEKIAIKVGCMHRTTVLHSVKTVKNMYDTDKKFAEKIQGVYAALNKRLTIKTPFNKLFT